MPGSSGPFRTTLVTGQRSGNQVERKMTGGNSRPPKFPNAELAGEVANHVLPIAGPRAVAGRMCIQLPTILHPDLKRTDSTAGQATTRILRIALSSSTIIINHAPRTHRVCVCVRTCVHMFTTTTPFPFRCKWCGDGVGGRRLIGRSVWRTVGAMKNSSVSCRS